MPRYSDELLNEIFSQNDIVDYVSQYVKLKKNGRDYTGLCPFHKEKTPSFFVNKEDQLFYCFGCHEGGNIINFVELHHIGYKNVLWLLDYIRTDVVLLILSMKFQ